MPSEYLGNGTDDVLGRVTDEDKDESEKEDACELMLSLRALVEASRWLL